MNKTIRLLISYDGSAYNGWQVQIDAPTVQGEMEKVFSRIFTEKIKIIGAGRTDAKAHGIAYTAHFRTSRNHTLPTDKIPIAANSLLPRDIRVIAAEEVSEDFHARFSAIAREYVYFIHESHQPLPHFLRYMFFYDKHPNLELLQKAASLFVGEHDFKSFCYGYPDLEERNTVRRIFYFRVRRFNGILIFYIKGSGFLQGMIRSLISVCLNTAEGKVSHESIQDSLQLKTRLENRYRVAVPANGLYFKRVYYPKETNTPLSE